MLALWWGRTKEPATASDCHGCSLCLLPCPMWQQHRDVMFSPQGICKSMQAGAKAEDMQAVLASCVACGACDVICPEGIDITDIIMRERKQLGLAEDVCTEAQGLTPFMMSCDPRVQAQLNEHDMYIIDAAVFHQHYEQRVAHYTSLREQTGCQLNLDLNRLAIPTGIGSHSAEGGLFDVKMQWDGLMQGRDVARMIVERYEDKEQIAAWTSVPVVHISDLMPVKTHENEVDDATS